MGIKKIRVKYQVNGNCKRFMEKTRDLGEWKVEPDKNNFLVDT